MKRLLPLAALLLAIPGCGGDADDDVARAKKILPMDQVPPAVLAAAKKAAPELTFFAAAHDTFQGRETIELKGKTKSGQIKELEISPDGTVLGTE